LSAAGAGNVTPFDGPAVAPHGLVRGRARLAPASYEDPIAAKIGSAFAALLVYVGSHKADTRKGGLEELDKVTQLADDLCGTNGPTCAQSEVR